jgi:hypothetical protein
MALQAEQLERLAEVLPLPQLRLPYVFDTDLGPEHVDVLADAVATGIAGLHQVPGAGAVRSAAPPDEATP